MRIRGEQPLAATTHPFSISRPDGSEWVVQLSALPLGFQRRLRERGIAAPIPPSRVARDSAGQVMKDRQGRAVLISDQHDADYLLEKERYQQRLAATMVWEALLRDPDIEFDACPPREGNWSPFADELCNELEAAGWSLGDVSRGVPRSVSAQQSAGRRAGGGRAGFSPARPGAGRTAGAQGPRSLEYLTWRFRERMRMPADQWNLLDREEQLCGLAYERLREREEQWGEQRTPNIER